jgi:arsenite transporter
MSTAVESIPRVEEPKRLNLFERYLTVWVALCMVAGIVFGKAVPTAVASLRGIEFGRGSQVNLPIAVLITSSLAVKLS